MAYTNFEKIEFLTNLFERMCLSQSCISECTRGLLTLIQPKLECYYSGN